MKERLHESDCKILVVEDNFADVELLKWALQGAEVDCGLTVIHDGAEALSYVREHGDSGEQPNDLAVLDLNVPKHDGVEILEAMRNTKGFEDLPVVVLTSSSSPRERSRLSTLNVTRIIAKPLDLDEFMKIGQVIKQVLEGREIS